MNKSIKEQKDVLVADDIKSVLDSALKFNRDKKAQGKEEVQNILLIGETGSGKTAIVDEWLKENNLNSYKIFSQWELCARLLEADGFESLNRPNTVLFLDMFDHAPKEARERVLEIVKTHAVSDPKSQGKKKKVGNFLFTIATSNPDSPAYNRFKFAEEEIGCFEQVKVVMTPQVLLNYLTKIFNKILQQETEPQEIKEDKGRLALANAILKNKSFKFDITEEVNKLNKSVYENALCYRTLTMLLLDCDGTKKDLLSKVASCVGKQALPMFEEILKDYHD